MPIPNADTLRNAFIQFRKDPLARFIINVRRMRAGQIRALLSSPEAITDAATFEQEIWNIESYTYLRDKGLVLRLFDNNYEHELLSQFMDQHKLTIADLDEALHAGHLELHGNYIFAQGTTRFAPHVKDEAQKVALLQQAVHILNDASSTPQQKVQQVDALSGFGENNATGLVMIFHPDELPLVNGATRETFSKLGAFSTSKPTLESMLDMLFSLKIWLKTPDFIELDWFLYLYGKSLPKPETAPEPPQPKPEAAPEPPQPAKRVIPVGIPIKFGHRVWVETIYQVLRDATSPLHPIEITRLAIELGLPTQAKDPVSSVVLVLKRNPHLFERVGTANRYRLKEGEITIEEEAIDNDNTDILSSEDKGGSRAPNGLKTPLEHYYIPILKAIDELGGAARINDVLSKVEVLMSGKLRAIDYEELPSTAGLQRWNNTARWARNDMVKRALLKEDSPRGVWEISEVGRDYLRNYYKEE